MSTLEEDIKNRVPFYMLEEYGLDYFIKEYKDQEISNMYCDGTGGLIRKHIHPLRAVIDRVDEIKREKEREALLTYVDKEMKDSVQDVLSKMTPEEREQRKQYILNKIESM